MYDYGLWPLVAVNVGLFAAFALGFLRPTGKREWRSLGVSANSQLPLILGGYN